LLKDTSWIFFLGFFCSQWIHFGAWLWIRFFTQPVFLAAILSTCDFFGERGVCGSLPSPTELPNNIIHVTFQGLAGDLLKQVTVDEINSWYPSLEVRSPFLYRNYPLDN
jgi:hypothetical protein